MKKTIAFVYSAFALFAFLVGFFSNSGPLDYVFVIIAGFPWTQILSGLLRSEMPSGPLIPLLGVLINAGLLWWWALRRR